MAALFWVWLSGMKYLLVLFFAIVYEIDARCPNGAYFVGNKCYFISKGSKSFSLAKTSCQDQYGNFASISNALDNADLTSKNYGWISLRSSLVVTRWLLRAECSAPHAAMLNAASAECTRNPFF